MPNRPRVTSKKRPSDRCRWRLHQRPAARSLAQQPVCANIHHGSTEQTRCHRTVKTKTLGASLWLLEKLQPCLVNQLHRATDVGNLFARLWDMIHILDIVAFKDVATRPMDLRSMCFSGCAMSNGGSTDKRRKILYR